MVWYIVIYIYIEYSSVVQCSIVQSCIYRIIQYDNVSYITGGCRLATEADKVSSVPALISCETLGLPQGRMSFHLSLITRAFLDGLATFKVSWPLIDAFRNYMKSHPSLRQSTSFTRNQGRNGWHLIRPCGQATPACDIRYVIILYYAIYIHDCTILHCTILEYSIYITIYHTILYYTILYCTVLYYIILYSTILPCIVLCDKVVCYTML